MNRRIVIAIDADLSLYTLHMLCVASSLLERSIPHLGAVLLHVIPVPDIPRSKFGRGRITLTAKQCERAEQVLRRARLALQQEGIAPERIELLLRSGMPASEIVKAATELEADFIMVGSRGNSFLLHLSEPQVAKKLQLHRLPSSNWLAAESSSVKGSMASYVVATIDLGFCFFPA